MGKNETGVPGFTLPGTVGDGEQGDYDKFSSGMGPYAPSEGRLGGGGWVDDPMAVSIKNDGIWAERPGADGEAMYEPFNVPQSYNGGGMGVEGTDTILSKVMGEDVRHMASRIG